MGEIKTIQWESDRICHYVLGELNDMRMSISKMFLEDVIGEDLGEDDTLNVNTIKYENTAVEGLFPGYPSKVSVDGTIALMLSYGDFPIPEEVRKWLVDAYENDLINEDNFPHTEDKFEDGRAILEAFLDAGIPYYAACAITGATYVECGWNVHVFNSTEKDTDKGAPNTGDWSGCGEGLFGLTFWTQKLNLIKKLNYKALYGVPDTPGAPGGYNDSRAKHLCDLDEEEWINMALEYLKGTAKKDYDVISNEDEPQSDDDLTEILAASYLWKAACGLEPTWDNVKETTLKYQNTHKRMHGENSVHDGFASQVCISIALDQYLHGEEKVDMNDLGININYEISSEGSTLKDKRSKPFKSKSGTGAGGRGGSGGGRGPNKSRTKVAGEPVPVDDAKVILPEGFDPTKADAKDIILEVKRGDQFNTKIGPAAYGKLYVNGQYWCDTAERNLIPSGIYKVAWRKDQGCTKTGRTDWIAKAESGNMNYRFATYSEKYVPLVLGTGARSGIRIHEGTGVGWSEGCLVLGKMNAKNNGLTDTWSCWKSLYDYCKNCNSCKIVYYSKNNGNVKNEQSV